MALLLQGLILRGTGRGELRNSWAVQQLKIKVYSGHERGLQHKHQREAGGPEKSRQYLSRVDVEMLKLEELLQR
jgi:hypothetical protein